MKRLAKNWLKVGLVVNVFVFILLTHVAFGLHAPIYPLPLDVYMMWVAWGLTGLDLVIKVIAGFFNYMFEIE